MKRAPLTVGELIKLLDAYHPEAQVRVWDMGYGDHVPAVELTETVGPHVRHVGYVFIEGASKEEMELDVFRG